MATHMERPSAEPRAQTVPPVIRQSDHLHDFYGIVYPRGADLVLRQSSGDDLLLGAPGSIEHYKGQRVHVRGVISGSKVLAWSIEMVV